MSKRLTAERRAENERKIDEYRRKHEAETRKARAEFDRLCEFMGLNDEQIKDFSANQMRHLRHLTEENTELVEKLNSFHRDHYYLTAGHVPPHIKRNIARMSLEHEDDSASMAKVFMAGMEVQRSLAGSRAAAQRLINDPRQTEKQFILDCWKDWMSGTTSYKSKAAFARDMIQKCEHLTSTKKVEDWCREWEKEHSSS